MADNFDLKKFLKENKALENLNPILKKENLSEGDLRSKIKEMILAELGNPDDYDSDPEEDYGDDELSYFSHMQGLEDEPEIDLEEAKKKKDEEVEDVETTDTETTEEVPAEDTPIEDVPAAGGGLEDVAADMEGTEGELMDHLMSAFKIAKGMNNEKLETQVGNTLKFFVSEYIGGGE